jgi:hypothetical protein
LCTEGGYNSVMGFRNTPNFTTFREYLRFILQLINVRGDLQNKTEDFCKAFKLWLWSRRRWVLRDSKNIPQESNWRWWVGELDRTVVDTLLLNALPLCCNNWWSGELAPPLLFLHAAPLLVLLVGVLESASPTPVTPVFGEACGNLMTRQIILPVSLEL